MLNLCPCVAKMRRPSTDGGVTPDGKSSPHRTALMVCPEEKDCLRLRGTLERFGLKAAFYTARDLSFYGAGRLLKASLKATDFLGGLGWTAVATMLVLVTVMILTLISALKWCGEKRK